VPEQFDFYGSPEQLLPGSDRPRPVSPALRARLEERLLGLAGVEGPAAAGRRPLSPEVRDRLENSLRPSAPARAGHRRNWKLVVQGAGVAAAIAILAAIVAPQLVHGPSGPGQTFAAQAAGPSVARPRLSPSASVALTGPAGAKSKGVPAGEPARSGPVRYAPSGGPGTAGPSRVGPGTRGPGRVGPGRVGPGTRGPGPALPVPGPVAAIVEGPVVSGVSPRHGPLAGGNWVVLAGQGFVGVSAITFGTSSTAKFIVESPVRLKVRAPAHAAGTVDIGVAGPAGRSNTSVLDHYTFDR
jgi:hypothetical protein